MAPGTTIGAATRVDLQGGEISDKVVNDAAAFAETVAAERNSTLIFPPPMELLRLVDAMRGAITTPNGSAHDGAERPAAAPDGDPAAA